MCVERSFNPTLRLDDGAETLVGVLSEISRRECDYWTFWHYDDKGYDVHMTSERGSFRQKRTERRGERLVRELA